MPIPDSPLFTATRWLVIGARILFIFGAVLCFVIAAASYFAWPTIAPELMKEHPAIDPVLFRPLFSSMLVAAGILLSVAQTGFSKLLALVDTARDGDPFTRENVGRLRALGWIMIGVEIASVPLHLLGKKISEQMTDFQMDAGVSLNGILAILLVFVLARVFEHGVSLRDDVEGTV